MEPNYEVFLNAEFRSGLAAALQFENHKLQLLENECVAVDFQYFTKNGRRVRPNYMYDAVRYTAKGLGSNASRNTHWLRQGDAFVSQLGALGVQTISLDPTFKDVRPFIWRGLLATPAYSACLVRDSVAESSARKEIKKAQRAGYTCEQTALAESAQLYRCLISTEARQNLPGIYSRTFGPDAFDSLLRLPQFVKCYVCKKDEVIAAFRLVIHDGSNTAHDWLAAVDADHLAHGVSDLLLSFAAKDLFNAGCEYFDLHGANVPNVQFFKFKHGARLIQSFQINTWRNVILSKSKSSLFKAYAAVVRQLRRKTQPGSA